MTTPSKPKLVKVKFANLYQGALLFPAFSDRPQAQVIRVSDSSAAFRYFDADGEVEFPQKEWDAEFTAWRIIEEETKPCSPLARRLAVKSPQEIDEELKAWLVPLSRVGDWLESGQAPPELTGIIDRLLADLSIPQEAH